MFVHIWCWAVYYLSRLTLETDAEDTTLNSNQSNTDSETIFADVIKNISRVNNVLQELITNYEHLQKLYKSQEIGSDYESKSGSDEKRPQKTKNHDANVKTNTDKPNDKFQAATEMIWSDDNNDDDNDDDVNEENDDDNSSESSKSNDNEIIQQKNIPKIESWQMATKKKKKLVTTDGEASDEKNKEKKESSDSDDEPIKAESSQEAKIIFVDTHKKRLHKLKAATKPTILPQYLEPTTKIKTRYVVKEPSFPEKYRGNDIDTKNILRQGNDSKHSIKNIVYTEKFSSKNIWDEIISNKPIQLDKEKVLTYDDNMNRIVNATDVSLRSNNVKNALVIVTDNNKKKKKKKSKTDISDEEEAINKDMFKTNILRKAYGDACLKLVVRKCFKACKAVGKKGCARYKCKGRFKSMFKENAKTGCIKYFRSEPNKTETTTGKNKTRIIINKPIDCRGKDCVMPEERATEFTDVTRGGYLAAACWPHASSPPTALRNNTPASDNGFNPDKELNILRDKYERACQRISRENCISACKYTFTTTCAGQDCSERMKRGFEKDCRSQCKLAYTVEKSDEEDESSEETSSETSESSESDSF